MQDVAMMYEKQSRVDPRIYFAVSRLFTSQLRVLVVADGSTDLGDLAGAPLGRVLGLSSPERWSHLQFDVTTAHRASVHADLGYFRFDRHDLAQYDQIWAWRTDSIVGEPLSHDELRAISTFMEHGGSVYAARS